MLLEHKLGFGHTGVTKWGAHTSHLAPGHESVRFAAAMDARLTALLRRIPLDRPLAAVARELGDYATSIGVPRPGYGCLRRHIMDEKLRRAERDAALQTAAELAFTRSIVPTPEGIEAAYSEHVRRRVAP